MTPTPEDKADKLARMNPQPFDGDYPAEGGAPPDCLGVMVVAAGAFHDEVRAHCAGCSRSTAALAASPAARDKG